MSKNYIDLPNKVPVKNAGNLTAEQTRYETLYKKANRTTQGQQVFDSPTSGVFYSTADYPDDNDVFNKGEEGMMNLLYKYVLYESILTAEDVKEIKQGIADVRNEMYARQDIGFENSVALMLEMDLYIKKQAGCGVCINRNYYVDCFNDDSHITILKGTFSSNTIIV